MCKGEVAEVEVAATLTPLCAEHLFQHRQCAIQTISTGIIPPLPRFQGHARRKSVLLRTVHDHSLSLFSPTNITLTWYSTIQSSIGSMFVNIMDRLEDKLLRVVLESRPSRLMWLLGNRMSPLSHTQALWLHSNRARLTEHFLSERPLTPDVQPAARPPSNPGHPSSWVHILSSNFPSQTILQHPLKPNSHRNNPATVVFKNHYFL